MPALSGRFVLSQIAKEAKDCVQECVSEFVSFITSEYPLHSFQA